MADLTDVQIERIFNEADAAHAKAKGHGTLRHAFARAILAAAVPQWQTIESAPKDGTVVIVGRHMQEFGFIRGYAHWEGPIRGFVSGWVSRGFDDVMSNLGLAHPTHWMALPAPPDTGAANG